MAFSAKLRTLAVFFFQISSLCLAFDNNYPTFKSVKVLNVNEKEYKNNVFKEIEFLVRGKNIISQLEIRTTKLVAKRNSLCKEQDMTNYNISEIRTSGKEGLYVLLYPKSNNDNVYFCLPHFNPETIIPSISESFHQGENVFLNSASVFMNNNNYDVMQVNSL